MKKITLHYGGEKLDVEIPAGATFHILKPRGGFKPLSTKDLKHKMAEIEKELPGEGLTLVVNDQTRPTRTDLILKSGWDYFKGAIERIIVATGSHSGPEPHHLKRMLGENLYREVSSRIISHSAREDPHEELGRTRRGTVVRVMQEFLASKYVLYINSVEPHYFAGFTGGRKSILPGVSSYDAIEQNHSHALDPGAKTLALEGNPVHEDMMEAASFVDMPHTSLQLVQSPSGELLDIFWGDIKESFFRAAEKAKDVFTSPAEGLYDVVIASVPPPMDLNLYQSQKGIENSKLALKDGGILLLLSTCREGIGPKEFWDLLTQEETPGEVLARIKEGYRLGYHKAAKIAEFVGRSRLWAVTEMDPDVLKRGFMKGYRGRDGVRRAVKEAIEEVGEGVRVLYVPDSTVMVPYVEEM